jgi:hypothetical protein
MNDIIKRVSRTSGATSSSEEKARRRWISNKCGRVKRDLLRNKRLTGKTLEFALAAVDQDSEIGEKLKAGRALTEYELHLMIVLLLHVRLGSRKVDLR